jgi:hypothetical protein
MGYLSEMPKEKESAPLFVRLTIAVLAFGTIVYGLMAFL